MININKIALVTPIPVYPIKEYGSITDTSRETLIFFEPKQKMFQQLQYDWKYTGTN
ncbi:MAG: hypothetical protein ACP5US_08930 [Candidatus Kryptoniota bacterium]